MGLRRSRVPLQWAQPIEETANKSQGGKKSLSGARKENSESSRKELPALQDLDRELEEARAKYNFNANRFLRSKFMVLASIHTMYKNTELVTCLTHSAIL